MEDVRRVLVHTFHLNSFRKHQEAAISRLLLEGRSALAVMPTGSGKSLCYQLPSQLLPGLTLVISPLKSLMKDQVDSLRAHGIKAGRLDSSQTVAEYQEVVAELLSGELKLLYVAPERLNMESFVATIKKCTIELLAVDEVHCVAEWGSHFRPDYLKIARFAQDFEARRVLCLTATATRKVARSICKAFNIERKQGVFRSPTYRPNLHLAVKASEDENGDVVARMKSAGDFYEKNPGSTIIYVTTRENAEIVADYLKEQRKIDARPYHAGLKDDVRKRNQEWFMATDNAVICATIAFGMGIDNPNIRNVLHLNAPKSIEGYSQEVGRAGRDGNVSQCVLYIAPGDREALESLARSGTPSPWSVRAFVKQLCKDVKAQDVVEGGVAEIDGHRYCSQLDIPITTLHLLFAKLELRYGYLRALTPLCMVYKFTSRRGDYLPPTVVQDSSRAAQIILSDSTFGRTLWTICVTTAAAKHGIDRTELVDKLIEWKNVGLEVEGEQQLFRYRIDKPLPVTEGELTKVADEMLKEMEDVEAEDLDRIGHVFEWASAPRCLPKGLAEHFNDRESLPDDAVCGNCSVCRIGGAATVVQETSDRPFDEAKFQAVWEATPHLRHDAHLLARVAFGVSSPFIDRKLKRSPVFGSMSDHRWDDLLARFKAANRHPVAPPPFVPRTPERKRKAEDTIGSGRSTPAKRRH